MNKKALSEATSAPSSSRPRSSADGGWDVMTQIREEVSFTKGRIIVRGKLVTRGKAKRADYILYYKPNIPIAVIEAKDNNHAVGDGMQQALDYAETLDIPFVFTSNGDGFLFHDRTGDRRHGRDASSPSTQFPIARRALGSATAPGRASPPTQEAVATQDYYDDGRGKAPRYYQLIAINRTVEAIAKGQNRILLVMATGTGKTYTAFQIIWRLWKAGRQEAHPLPRRPQHPRRPDHDERLQALRPGDDQDHQPHRSTRPTRSTSALYQAVTGTEEEQNIYKQFSPDFFDLIVVDECHRGSAAEDSAWREILDYFSSATQIGLTATPKETKDVSNIDYFGDPVYTYSLKQGIDDGFLAPYKVIRIDLDKDLDGWRPEKGKLDKLRPA